MERQSKVTVAGTLHVVTGLGVGGAEASLAKLVLAEYRRGRRVFVVALRNGGAIARELRGAGIPVYTLFGRWCDGHSPNGIFPTLAAVRRFRPTCILGWMYHGILAAQVVSLMTRTRAPIIWNIRCTLDMPNWRLRTRLIVRLLVTLSRYARRVVYNSESGRTEHERLGYRPDRSMVIDNGVDAEVFSPKMCDRSNSRTSLGIRDGEFVIGHVARFHPMKGHQVFLDALARLQPTGPVCAVMVGAGVVEGNSLCSGFTPGNMSAVRILPLGECRDIARILRACDAFCMSSVSGEGFPNVVLEAMATGLPVIVTGVGDAARVVDGCGIVVAPGDAAKLAAAITAVVDMPIASRNKLGVAARDRAVAHFSDSTNVKNYCELISSTEQ